MLARGPVWTHVDEVGNHLYRIHTPVILYLLDRWFRLAEIGFDRLEWRFPWTARITGIPCEMYARRSAKRAMWEDIDVFVREPDDDDLAAGES